MEPSEARVTLGKIAAKAGVSRATVSRALRNNPQLPRETCERIQKLAEEMGWRPDPATSRLMHHLRESRHARTDTTLAVLNDYPEREAMLRDPYTAALLASARARAAALGYRMDEIWLRGAGMTARRANAILRARGIVGLLIPPEVDPLPRFELDWSQFSAVATTTTALPRSIHRVLPDNYGNMRRLMEAVLGKGHKRVWLLSMLELEARTEDCSANVCAAYAVRHPDLEPLPAFFWDAQPRSRSAAAMSAAFANLRPDAVLVADGWLLHELETRTGTRRGRDYAAYCFSNTAPGLPGIDQRPAAVGAAAIDLLSAHVIRGETGLPEVPKLLRIPGELRGLA